jgi:periplasmic divalent cation tolerance protein
MPFFGSLSKMPCIYRQTLNKERKLQNTYSLIITTAPDKESAKVIAKLLVEKQLAACVQMFPIESIYTWKNEVCCDDEVILFIKSKSTLFKNIAAAIKENHKYEVPEIIQIPVTDGLPEYLKWIENSVV